MNTKTNKKLLQEAIESGCKTVAQLAHFLKARNMAHPKLCIRIV